MENNINRFFQQYEQPLPEYKNRWQKIGSPRPIVIDVRPVQNFFSEWKFWCVFLGILAALFGLFAYVMLHLNAWLP